MSDPQLQNHRSPCLFCQRVHLTKVDCCQICDRLNAFVRGSEWIGLSIPTMVEINKISRLNQKLDKNDEDPGQKLMNILKLKKVRGKKKK